MRRSKRQLPAARRIKAALALRGLTQVELAHEMGLHVNTVCGAINHGLNEPTLRAIEERLNLKEELEVA